MAKKRRNPYTEKILNGIEDEKSLQSAANELTSRKKELKKLLIGITEKYYLMPPNWKEYVAQYNDLQNIHSFIEIYKVLIEKYEAKMFAAKGLSK